MEAFWSQLFILRKKLVKEIDKVCRIFVWTGKDFPSRKSPMAWEKVCLPKEYGGLNFRALIPSNKTAVLKLIWALALKSDILWVQWIHTYYVKSRYLMSIVELANATWMVKKILRQRSIIQSWGF